MAARRHAERVDRLAQLLLEDGRAEADAELGDADAHGFRGEHVA
jgi:hypothetical protein